MNEKTRLLSKGKYLEDPNELVYKLDLYDDKSNHVIGYVLRNKDIFYIDEIPVLVSIATTNNGSSILLCSYRVGTESYTCPLFNDQTGWFAWTKGAMKNGLIHRNRTLNKIEKSLIDKNISIRCVKYVDTRTELEMIYSNVQMNEEKISKMFLAYMNKHKIKTYKILPQRYEHYEIYPLKYDEFKHQADNGFIIIEKFLDADSRVIPSLIFINKTNYNEELLLETLEKYKLGN